MTFWMPSTTSQSGTPAEGIQRAGALLAIGVPVLIYFAATAAMAGDLPLFWILAVTIGVIGTTFVFGRGRSLEASALIPMLACVSMLMLYVVRHSAVEHSRALWFFTLPVIALTALRPVAGALWSLCCIVIAVVLMATVPEGGASPPYAPAFIVRFAITACVITGALMWTDILVARYRATASEQHATLEQEARRLEQEIAQRKALELELRVLATTDPLTDLLNRRAFFGALENELQRSLRLGRPLALVILDVDHFKEINDRFGHPAGDAALVHLSRTLRQTLRGIDLIGRIGGEEFAAILLETEVTATPPIGERLLASVRSAPVLLPDGTPLPMTISIGGSQAQPGDSIEALIKRADDALYQAKAEGRDRYCAR